MDRERMKVEALNRMKILGLMPEIINKFKRSDTLYYSEPTPLRGILYWMSNEPEWEKIVAEVEKTYGCLVYHGVHSYTEFSEMLSLLIVSRYEDEWEFERENASDGYVFTYTHNFDNPMFSELGDIFVEEMAGGLVRRY